MNIALNDLEEKFLATALKNGLSYWKKDHFEVVDDNSNGIKARVYGTDEYLSELVLSGNTVTDVNCTCPNNRTLFLQAYCYSILRKTKICFRFKKSKA
ncbi:SWIM zinc finger family protein [Jejuia pallidilutea]|uniref:Uncharacterized protein n=1 Tax=Jejuia pallidilutea TaxID=504487 RepID=A0A090WXF7_9FLAO|nr:hypothetical protein [Jejuia pallidilutea]GAL72022.1 hypothetical protein JCM19302_367 [Jejuia pallidilutea]